MKNLRKVLAMVLVVALAFSLVTFASAAKLSDYKDASSIKQKEAVDVLSQAGVLAGADGSFNPTDNFTREQAAKVITYLMLGTNVANSLQTTTSSFSDVAVTRWSAPYIQYCATAGVLNGMGDGTFAPEGKVTGTQFAKMILTALGYGKNGEYVGANWEINTLKDAASLEILDLDVNYTAPATREQVAQYALNALLLSAVVWDKNTDQYLAKTVNGANYFANKLELVRTATMEGGVSGYKWTKDGNTVGFYADETLIASDATGLAISMMTDKYNPTYSLFFKADLDKTEGVYYFYNGAPIHIYTNNTTVHDDAATFDDGDLFVYDFKVYEVLATNTGANIIADIAHIAARTNTLVKEYAKRGAVISFINTDKDTKAETVSIIEKTVVQATGAPTVTGANVKIPGLPNPAAGSNGLYNADKIVYPTGIEADDYLLYYVDGDTGVTYVEKAQVVTGTAANSTSVFGVYQYNISGTARKSSELIGSVDGDDPSYFNNPSDFYNGGIWTAMQTSFNTELKVWIDNGGNIIDFEAATNSAETSNYAVVLEAAPLSASFTTGAEAMLLFTDGTTKLVTLGKVNTATATSTTRVGGTGTADALEGQFVTYTVATDGKYNVKTTSAIYNEDGPFRINRVSKFINNSSYLADNTTVFITKKDPSSVFGDADYYDYVVLKGVANAPATTDASAQDISIVKFTSTGNVKYVFVGDNGNVDTTLNVEKVAYVIYDGLFVNYTIVPENADKDQPEYYEYKAIVDGQATTIKVDNTAGAGAMLAFTPGMISYDDADGDGYIDTTGSATGATVGTGTAKASNGVIKLGGIGYTYNSDTEVYFIDAFGGVTKKTVADINRDTDDVVTAYLTPNGTDAADLLDAIYITVK